MATKTWQSICSPVAVYQYRIPRLPGQNQSLVISPDFTQAWKDRGSSGIDGGNNSGYTHNHRDADLYILSRATCVAPVLPVQSWRSQNEKNSCCNCVSISVTADRWCRLFEPEYRLL